MVVAALIPLPGRVAAACSLLSLTSLLPPLLSPLLYSRFLLCVVCLSGAFSYFTARGPPPWGKVRVAAEATHSSHTTKESSSYRPFRNSGIFSELRLSFAVGFHSYIR